MNFRCIERSVSPATLSSFLNNNLVQSKRMWNRSIVPCRVTTNINFDTMMALETTRQFIRDNPNQNVEELLLSFADWAETDTSPDFYLTERVFPMSGEWLVT